MKVSDIGLRSWLFMRVNERHLLQFFAAISTAYGFWTVFQMDEYLPWQVRFFRAIELTFIAHFGLWLATFEWRGKVRFLVPPFLLLSVVGVLILWWHYSIPLLGWLGWRMFQLIKGPSLETQSL